jgi:hypothetical protein
MVRDAGSYCGEGRSPEPHIRAMFVGDFSAVVLAAVRAQE